MSLTNPSEAPSGLTFGLNTPMVSDYELRTQGAYTGSHNSLGVNYFQFNTPRIPNLSEFVQQVNLPSISNLQVDHPTSFGVNVPHPSGKYIFEDLTVTFLVDETMKNWLEIYDWITSIGSPGVSDYTKRIAPEQFHSTGLFTILNSSYQPKFQVEIFNLFPVGLSGVQFSTVSSDSEPVFCTVTFAYSHYEITPVKTASNIPAISEPVNITNVELSTTSFSPSDNEVITANVDVGDDAGEAQNIEYTWYSEPYVS